MRWILVALMAFASIAAQANLKATSPHLPMSLAQALDMGVLRSIALVLRAGSFSGLSLLLTWYCYRYFGFLELFVASAVTYVLAVIVGHYMFAEPITWPRAGGVLLVMLGVGLFFFN
jgi:multidrug transporter EmrE-like cation transporter